MEAVLSFALRAIRRDGYDVVLNNSLGPLPYTMLPGQPTVTVLHTPPTLEKVNAVITRPGWRPDRCHRYVSVSEFNSASWADRAADGQLHPERHLPRPLARPRQRRTRPRGSGSARIAPEKGLHLAIDAARRAGLRLEFTGPIASRTYFDTEIGIHGSGP